MLVPSRADPEGVQCVLRIGADVGFYEFISRGILRDWLNAKSGDSLSLLKRLRVALDSAKAILYLHTEANPPIFYHGIKTSNILIDSKLTSKIADFGLSRLAPSLDDYGVGPNYVSTVVRGQKLARRGGKMGGLGNGLKWVISGRVKAGFIERVDC
ncbi:probable LRR receptor-like serine/threonine-protein kinase isoform X2 [Tanacetum coccineum]